MKIYVAVTDGEWYGFLRSKPQLDEVNFWQPGGNRKFEALESGEPFLFKLHYPEHFIVGGGFFAHASIFPVSMAWDAFGEKNGATTFEQMRHRIERYRRSSPDPHNDYKIGCIILEKPFFLDRSQWISVPGDFSRNIVQGKTYDWGSELGRSLWDKVMFALRTRDMEDIFMGEGGIVTYGEPTLIRPRLGQGAFRLLVTDTYQRRCAVTGEKALPVLQAAHIKPIAVGGYHRIENGLLLRSDLHTLFDRGYVTVTPDYHLRVSRRLKSDFDNGEHYYRFQNTEIWLPPHDRNRPKAEHLEWHADTVFLR